MDRVGCGILTPLERHDLILAAGLAELLEIAELPRVVAERDRRRDAEELPYGNPELRGEWNGTRKPNQSLQKRNRTSDEVPNKSGD